MENNSICVVIPCYKVRDKIRGVIDLIDDSVKKIYVIDDKCPERTGDFVRENCFDERLVIINHYENLGVGGAVLTGYSQAIMDGMDLIVKIDGDGQMDPRILHKFTAPIIAGDADYAKGNRFYDIESIHSMPMIRVFGNTALSFITKFSSGYWNVFDPTNGYTVIHAKIAKLLPYNKINKRFFFESDILFRLNLLQAVVVDIPMASKYEDEKSNLNVFRAIPNFLFNNIRNMLKRIMYKYYLRDLHVASFELPIGVSLLTSGLLMGSFFWIKSSFSGIPSNSGSVTLVAIQVLIGIQFLLAFISYDTNSMPRICRHKYL